MSALLEALVSFEASLATRQEPAGVLHALLDHLPSLLPLRAVALVTIDDATLLPTIALRRPSTAQELDQELARIVEDGSFALALRRGEAVVAERSDRSLLLVQACADPEHLAGLVLAIVERVDSEQLALLAVLAARTATAHHNRELLAQQRAHAAQLERMVAERTRELAAALEKAETASRAKSAFLATMSHELRTPLNGIIGLTDTLMTDERDAVRRERLAVVRSCAEALLAQIEGILDFSRIEAGKLELVNTECDPEAIAVGVLRALAPRAASKGLQLLWLPSADFPARVWLDDHRLQQVLTNLVGNAVKFTERGRVIVRGAAQCQDGRWQLAFTVDDSGPGIAPEVQARLFTPFSQGDARINRRYGGTGLGLSIARHLCRAMGGDIALESAVGVGSRFTARVSSERGVPWERSSSALPRIAVLASGWLKEAALACLQRLGTQPCAAAQAEVLLVDASDAPAVAEAAALPEASLLLAISPTASSAPAALAARRHATVLVPFATRDLAEALAKLAAAASDRASRPAEAAPPLAGLQVLAADDQEVNRLVLELLLQRLGVAALIVDGGAAAVALSTARRWDAILLDCQMPDVDGFTAAARIRAFGVRAPLIAVTADASERDREHCLAHGFDDFVPKPVELAQLAAALSRQCRRAPEAAEPAPSEQLAALRAEIGGEAFAAVVQAFLAELPAHLAAIADAVAQGDLPLVARHAHAVKGDAANLRLRELAAAAKRLEQAAKAGDREALAPAAEELRRAWSACAPLLSATAAS
ncbi:MAG: ATP-binding protein [Planctomycetes bacterium]|nr:ATP-binding protein [Planctomycetota bacterium]